MTKQRAHNVCDPQHLQLQPEPNEIRMRPVLIAIAVVAAVLLLAHPLTIGIVRYFTPVRAPDRETYTRTMGPAEHWLDPAGDLAALRRRENERLSRYAWVDAERGIVRIPIAKAIELTLRQGAIPPPASVRNNDAQP